MSNNKDMNFNNKPIFNEPWWLNAFCGENEWEYSKIEKEGNCIASMPWVEIKNRFGISLIWNAIKFASNNSNIFDFEGSMIRPIENFFRAFGGIQAPYLLVEKTNSKILKFLKKL